MTTGGDDIEYFGTGFDTTGSPPASGLVTSIDVDLSDNNFGTPDVEITGITRPNAFGNPFPNARLDVITNSAEDFFNEVLALDDTMTGSAFNDTFKSGGGNDELDMGGGNDTAEGGDGDDELNGEAGNDTLNGEAGIDTMNGGSGNDTLVVDNNLDTTTGGTGIDLVQSSVTRSLLSADLENLTLTGAGVINGTGNALANVINGNAAANTLSGLGGNDVLNGNAGNDMLLGSIGNDTLNGGFGVDNMQGSFGNDTYTLSTTPSTPPSRRWRSVAASTWCSRASPAPSAPTSRT